MTTHSILALGPPKSGKTRLLEIYYGIKFIEHYCPTRVFHYTGFIEVGGDKKHLPKELESYLNRPHKEIWLCVSVEDKLLLCTESETGTNAWLEYLAKIKSHVPIRLIITKVDLYETTSAQSRVEQKNIDDFIKKVQHKGLLIWPHALRTSAKENIGIDKLGDIFNTLKTISFPLKYHKIWGAAGNDPNLTGVAKTVAQMKALLRHYTMGINEKGSFGAIVRLFHGHINRHHCDDVLKIIQRISKNELQTPTEILDALEKIPDTSPHGSLKKRIEFIKLAIMGDCTLAENKTSAFKNDNAILGNNLPTIRV